MSIQSEPAAGGTSSGAGLAVSNGLPLPGSTVNQSAGTAQVQLAAVFLAPVAASDDEQHHPAHHPPDPYANYATYPAVVAYNAPYPHNASPSASSQYYLHTSHALQNDPQHIPHHEPSSGGHADLTAQQPQQPPNHHGSHVSEVGHQDQIHGPDHAQNAQATYQTPQRSPVEPSASSPVLVGDGAKRGPPVSAGSVEEHLPATKKRKQRPDNSETPKEESDVGPSGGAKHWTDDEKTRLFQWMLTDDNRWEAFGTKMNTIFREGSAALFGSRKTFTALKSCYHRNLDVFKQIWAFEAFLAKAPAVPLDPPSAPPPQANSEGLSQQELQEIADELLPSAFATPAQRQSFLERKLEAARNFNVPVGNLTVRVLDHWQETGWYILFKKRFREDPHSGMPVPRYGSMRHLDEHSPDGRMDEDDGAGTSSVLRAPRANDSLTDVQRRHLDSNDCLIPLPFPNQPAASRGSGAAHRPQRTPPPPSTGQPFRPGSPTTSSSARTPGFPYPPPPGPFFAPSNPQGDYQTQQFVQQQIHLQAQTAQALTHLTNMTQTLLGTCTTLTELVRTQMEDSKVQTELMRKRDERDQAGSSASGSGSERQRAASASDLLSDPRTPDDIKKLAADYLKRMFQ